MGRPAKDDIARHEKIKTIVQLRKIGWDYEEIAQKTGTTEVFCYRIVCDYVKKCKELTYEDAEMIRHLDLQRIETALRVMQYKILDSQTEPDPVLLRTFLAFLERKSKLLGLDLMQVTKTEGTENETQKALVEFSLSDLR
jgi:cyanate lyase